MTRHRFEPTRLLLGLCLTAIGVVYALDGLVIHAPMWLLMVTVPAAFALAACTAIVTVIVRGGNHYFREDRGADRGLGHPSAPHVPQEPHIPQEPHDP